jgi:tRNA 2-thiouridine synthesizing protein A
MSERINPDKTLDCRGQKCPIPIIKTKKELENLKSGQILEILGTDVGTKNDLPSFAEKSGNEFLQTIEDPEGFFRFYLRKL